MNLEDLHLEENALPKNYREVIADRRDITPELKEEGFISGTWGKNRRYNFVYKQIDPFVIRVIERNVENDEVDDVLHYQLEFHIEEPIFAPFLKFIKEWGKKNGKIIKKLNCYFWEWLWENMENNYTDAESDEVYVKIPSNQDEVLLQITDEALFFRLLKDISASFRVLATEHSADPYDMAAEFEYDDSDLKGKKYWEMANHVLTPMVLRGLIEGLTVFRQKVESGDTDDSAISIEIKKRKKSMLFYYGDDCKGTPFFEFEIGSVLSKCLSKMRDEDLEYDRELSHWFSDAVAGLPEKVYKGLNVCIEVPETEGDPVFENYD